MYKSTRYDKFNKCRLCTLSVVINGQRLMIMYKKKINVKKHISANEKYFIDLCADCMRWEGGGWYKNTAHMVSEENVSTVFGVYTTAVQQQQQAAAANWDCEESHWVTSGKLFIYWVSWHICACPIVLTID